MPHFEMERMKMGTYDQGVADGIKKAFDCLMNIAANTDNFDKAGYLQDAAESVLEYAQEYNAQWAKMEDYRRRLLKAYGILETIE